MHVCWSTEALPIYQSIFPPTLYDVALATKLQQWHLGLNTHNVGYQLRRRDIGGHSVAFAHVLRGVCVSPLNVTGNEPTAGSVLLRKHELGQCFQTVCFQTVVLEPKGVREGLWIWRAAEMHESVSKIFISTI